MTIDITEAFLLILGGVMIATIFSLAHFTSTYHNFNRSLAFISPILGGSIATYAIILFSEDGDTSVSDAIAQSLVAFIHLLPLFLAVSTIILLRITLLTNRSVGASS